MEDLYNTKSPSIKTLCAINGGYNAARNCLQEMLIEFAALSGISKMADATQQRVIVEDIMDDYPEYTIADFKLFFKKCRKGEFGTSYGTLDEPTLMQWLKRFISELDNYIEEKHYQEHLNKKNTRTIFDEQTNGTSCPPEIAAHLDEVLNSIGKKKPDMSHLRLLKEQEIRNKVHEEYKSRYEGANAEEQVKILAEEIKAAESQINAIRDEDLQEYE